MELVQILECGKHDILPVAGASLDHARVPVTLPRDSDADMRLDGSTTAQTVQNQPSMSADECTAHRNLDVDEGTTDVRTAGRTASRNGAGSDRLEQRRRRWPRRERKTRLRGQGKSAASARCSWWFSRQSNQQLASSSAASFATRAAGACRGFARQYRGLGASFPTANGLGA